MNRLRVRMKVEGGDRLVRRLQMLAEETARKHMREAALEGAEVFRAEAEEKAPRKTGTLAEDMQKELVKQTKARVEIKVGPGKKGWYGRLVEEGHAIVVGGRRKAKKKPGRVVGHAPPQPFLRPAFDEKVGEAQDVIAAELRRRLKLS
ncbi:MAG: HK97 gp10 family phage protein [Candidatus Syntrophopropionicum ammoniitolerans]